MIVFFPLLFSGGLLLVNFYDKLLIINVFCVLLILVRGSDNIQARLCLKGMGMSQRNNVFIEPL